VGPTCQRGEREAGYRFGGGALLGRGLFWSWAEWFSPGPFYIFIFFLLFFFCFSYFFQNFCKDTSIQTKLLPEIFKRGAQYSKLVIKQVFKKKGYYQ
jgi:hypothetical protein